MEENKNNFPEVYPCNRESKNPFPRDLLLHLKNVFSEVYYFLMTKHNQITVMAINMRI